MVSGQKLHLNEGTIKSFESAVNLYLKLKKEGQNVSLGILLNNIGCDCSGKDKCTKQTISFNENSFTLPINYKRTLKKKNINEHQLLIIWEKYIRNRSKKEFLKSLKKKETRERITLINGDLWLKSDLRGRIILTRSRNKDKYGAPACPLIMAGLYKHLEKMGFGLSINCYYIGSDNLTNIPNHNVIEKGMDVYNELFKEKELKVFNLYSS